MAGYTTDQVSAFRRTFQEYAGSTADNILLQNTFPVALNKCLTSIGLRPLTDVEAAEQFQKISQNSVVHWAQFFQVRFRNVNVLVEHVISKSTNTGSSAYVAPEGPGQATCPCY